MLTRKFSCDSIGIGFPKSCVVVTAFLVFGVNFSYAKDYWVPFYTQADNGDIFYFDNQGISIENFGSGTRIVNVDVLVNKFETFTTNSGRAVNSMKTTYSYNCFNRRIRRSEITMFSGKDGKGSRVEVHPSSGEWVELRNGAPTAPLAQRLRPYCG